MPQDHKPRLLIVDDDDGFRELVKITLTDEGYDIDTATDGPEGLTLARDRLYDLVLLDMRMPRMDGMEVLKILRQETPATDVVMITGVHDVDLAIEAIKLGAREFLAKPIDGKVLVQRIRTALRAHTAELRLQELQSEFTSRLLHELRNPLGTVRSAIGFLKKEMAGPTTEQQQNVLEHIENNLSKMDLLLNDMIDLTVFESGKLDIQKLPTNLDELIPLICARFKPQAAAKNVTINVNIDNNIPTIELDPDKIEQVIDNLLDNGLKYTNAGGTISVGVATAQQKSNGGDREFVEIKISDTGVGISAGEIPFVFDKYKEFLTGKTSTQKTTGLGLAICRSIVDAHKGSMSVESTLGKGSTFRVFLPTDTL